MSAVFSPNKNLIEPASGSFNNAWAAPVNSNWSIIDQALGGTAIIVVDGVPGPYIGVSVAQYQCQSIIFEGTLSANLTYIVPTGVGGQWTILNVAAGAFSITFNLNAGTSVNCPYGSSITCWSDGVNMRLSDNGTAYAYASAAQTAAQTYADGVAGTAQSNAESAAQGYANTAQSNAETYAASVAGTAQSNAQSYAASVANAAQSNAESYAGGVAAAAQSNAQSYAATVANAAQSNAETYAAGLITSGTNGNGTWIQFPDGTIMQWGETATYAGNNYTQVYPIVFPNTCRSIQLTPIGVNSTYYTTQPGQARNAFGLTAGTGGTQFSWVAYGR